jgi:hypothetical protein
MRILLEDQPQDGRTLPDGVSEQNIDDFGRKDNHESGTLYISNPFDPSATQLFWGQLEDLGQLAKSHEVQISAGGFSPERGCKIYLRGTDSAINAASEEISQLVAAWKQQCDEPISQHDQQTTDGMPGWPERRALLSPIYCIAKPRIARSRDSGQLDLKGGEQVLMVEETCIDDATYYIGYPIPYHSRRQDSQRMVESGVFPKDWIIMKSMKSISETLVLGRYSTYTPYLFDEFSAGSFAQEIRHIEQEYDVSIFILDLQQNYGKWLSIFGRDCAGAHTELGKLEVTCKTSNKASKEDTEKATAAVAGAPSGATTAIPFADKEEAKPSKADMDPSRHVNAEGPSARLTTRDLPEGADEVENIRTKMQPSLKEPNRGPSSADSPDQGSRTPPSLQNLVDEVMRHFGPSDANIYLEEIYKLEESSDSNTQVHEIQHGGKDGPEAEQSPETAESKDAHIQHADLPAFLKASENVTFIPPP